MPTAPSAPATAGTKDMSVLPSPVRGSAPGIWTAGEATGFGAAAVGVASAPGTWTAGEATGFGAAAVGVAGGTGWPAGAAAAGLGSWAAVAPPATAGMLPQAT